MQFAKTKGAYVIGLASAGNLVHLRQLGADEVLDYRSQPFEELVHDVDVVFDASPLRDSADRLKLVSVLKPGGVLVSVNVDFPFTEDVLAALAKKQATGELVAVQSRQDWLAEIAQLIDAGKIKVIVNRVFPLE